ncbi:MAG: bifunctional demethylmenaquinone methyltransferase/2-methoxy-6-polyprenyl-1,4-benzoquinol methylase UbiE [Chloroflexota bacterium]|nr:bifunctional demethylmenaquinone methyltransferase/2-methoxy-6-polyprenyl-1,4-benzoquinol methylase UbiE [Chloroflexota bacterium]
MAFYNKKGTNLKKDLTETTVKHVISAEKLPGFRQENKAQYVNRMFTQIAPTYDRVNRLMTFGLDQGWRKTVVAEARLKAGERALDVATGTGDIALALAHQVGSRGKVVGSDFCLEMMLPGPAKAAKAGVGGIVQFMAADAMRLPFASNSFEAVTTGFAMRNVTDIERAFSEMCRVVKPGGRVVCLEVARPRWAIIRWGHQLYFNRIVPMLGRLISGHGEAYTYLPESARNFPPPEELKRIMERAGLTQVSYRLYGLGAAAIHLGVKPSTPGRRDF